MSKLPKALSILDESLKELGSKPGFTNCQRVVNSIASIMGVTAGDDWKVFTDSQRKIKANHKWFMLAEGFADRRAAYKIADGNDSNIDFKAYWMKNLSKSVTSWLSALTPNFEDESFYGKMSIGIDFIIPEAADRVIVVLSNHYVLRTLDLQGSLKNTQVAIFEKWLAKLDFENKAQVHKVLWDSFDLEPVNKDFYKGISTRFVQLKQHLVDKGVFDDKHAAIFTNRLIGRIVFCWFLDKKGIVNPEMKYFDTEGAKANEYYHAKLETLFFRVFNTPKDERSGEKTKGQKRLFPETDPKNLFNASIDLVTPFLNGGLFEERDDEVAVRFKLDFPKNYFDDLYDFLRHYNFTTDESTSTFQQVAIDPEMLGRIFENLLAEQIEETGEQARKAKGAFYTPREIVDYMCKESLREYLKSKITDTEDRDQRLSLLLDKKAHEYRDQQTNYKRDLKPYKNDIIEALDNIKVIDPACGSGAFPMGMLQLLLQCYERLEPRFDSYKSKLTIIKNSLYGVDIEPMAVEISRLRAWLSIVVDETSDVKPLPNLDFKFVCANSLIPVPGDQDMTLELDPFFSDLESKIEKYFLATDHEQKDSLKSEITKLIDARVKEKLKHVAKLGATHSDKKLSEYLKKKNKKALEANVSLMNLWNSYPNIFTTDQPVGFFEPKYFFPSAKGGFDIVIANPPYGTAIRGDYRKQIVSALGKVPDYEIYYYFIELSKRLLREFGTKAYIIPNTFLFNVFAAKYRISLLDCWHIKILVDCTAFKLFEAATVHNAISIFTKSVRGSKDIGYKHTLNAKSFEELASRDTLHISRADILLNNANWGLAFKLPRRVLDLVTKMKNLGVQLKKLHSDISQGLIAYDKYQGQDRHTIENRVFHFSQKSSPHLKKWLNGEDVRKCSVVWNEQEWIDYCDGLANPRQPRYFKGPRILVREITNPSIYAGFTKEELYHDPSIIVVLDNGEGRGSLLYILGILNSKLASFYHFNSSPKATKGSFPKILVKDIKEFPIKVGSNQFQERLKELVEKVLAITCKPNYSQDQSLQEEVSKYEKRIDECVYGLYELTSEEIAIVEGITELI